jgi:hypothetical protein
MSAQRRRRNRNQKNMLNKIMTATNRAYITITAALMLATALMLTILAGRAVAADEEDNFPDWIFSCPVYGDVYIWGNSITTFLTIRGARPPFSLTWIKEDEPELTMGGGKCELIYPVEQS